MDDWRKVYNESEPRKSLEVPAPDWVFTHQPAVVKPESEIEALMMSAPGDWVDPDTDTGDTYDNLEEIFGVELDLSELEKEVLDAVFVAGHSIRGAADLLGLPQTTVWRVKESALDRIRKRIQ